MANTIKYTDQMVAEALAMRKRGEKQAVIHATFGAGIESAIIRVQARDRKRASRESVGARVELPLPEGTAAALERVCAAAGDVPVALLSQQIHLLDRMLRLDPAKFAELTGYKIDVSSVVAKHIDKVGGDPDGQ